MAMAVITGDNRELLNHAIAHFPDRRIGSNRYFIEPIMAVQYQGMFAAELAQ